MLSLGEHFLVKNLSQISPLFLKTLHGLSISLSGSPYNGPGHPQPLEPHISNHSTPCSQSQPHRPPFCCSTMPSKPSSDPILAAPSAWNVPPTENYMGFRRLYSNALVSDRTSPTTLYKAGAPSSHNTALFLTLPYCYCYFKLMYYI